jgi:hypothetical protein
VLVLGVAVKVKGVPVGDAVADGALRLGDRHLQGRHGGRVDRAVGSTPSLGSCVRGGETDTTHFESVVVGDYGACRVAVD